MKRLLVGLTLLASMTSVASASDTCNRVVKENSEGLMQVSSISNTQDASSVMSTLADIWHAELVEQIENEEISLEAAQLVFEQEVVLRQCANYYGFSSLKSLGL